MSITRGDLNQINENNFQRDYEGEATSEGTRSTNQRRRVQSCGDVSTTATLLELELKNRENKHVVTKVSKNANKSMVKNNEDDCLHYKNRVTVFQASPLIYIDARTGTKHPFPLPDFEYEKQVLTETLCYNDGNNHNTNNNIDIELQFEVATVDKISSYFLSSAPPQHQQTTNKIVTTTTNDVLHFSAHGHPEYLAIENGSGAMQPLLVEQLREFISAASSTTSPKKKKKKNANGGGCGSGSGGGVKVVFVSACHSKSAGQAFIDAGIKHVVCCHQDEQLRDVAAIEFAKNFYKGLLSGKTLKESFILAKKTPIHHLFYGDANEMDKFVLLPEKPMDDTYHDVHIFNSAYNSTNNDRLQVNPSTITRRLSNLILPRPPKLFLGRELHMYDIIEELQTTARSRLIYVTGEKGVGKSSLVQAVVHYVRERSNCRKQYIVWIPSPFTLDDDDDDECDNVNVSDNNNNSSNNNRTSSFSSLSDDNDSHCKGVSNRKGSTTNHENNRENNNGHDMLLLLLRHFQRVVDEKMSESTNDSASGDGTATTSSCSTCSNERPSFFRRNSGSIIDALYDMNVLIVIDGNNTAWACKSDNDNNSSKKNNEDELVRTKIDKLISLAEDVIAHTLHVKVVLICPPSFDPSRHRNKSTSPLPPSVQSSQPVDERIINVSSLNIRTSALLFGQLCPHVSQGRCSYIKSPNDLVKLLVLPQYQSFDEYGNKSSIDGSSNNYYTSKRYKDIYTIIGEGVPERIRSNALTMTAEDYDSLICIGERKEFDSNNYSNISTRVELENEIDRVSENLKNATNEHRFELAKELHATHEELINLRKNRPSYDDLKRSEQRLNQDLSDAIRNNRYTVANKKQQELVSVKNQLQREIDANPHFAIISNSRRSDTKHQPESGVVSGQSNEINTNGVGKVKPAPLPTEGTEQPPHGKDSQTNENLVVVSDNKNGHDAVDIESLADDICTIVHERLLHCVKHHDDKNRMFATKENNKQQGEGSHPQYSRKLLRILVLVLFFVLVAAIVTVSVMLTHQKRNAPTNSPSVSLQPSVKPSLIPTFSSPPSLRPSFSPSFSPTMAVILTVVFKLDSKPEETGWKLDCGYHSGRPIRNIANVPAGVYSNQQNDYIFQPVEVGDGEFCRLVVTDSGGDGIVDGYYKVFEGILSISEEIEQNIAIGGIKGGSFVGHTSVIEFKVGWNNDLTRFPPIATNATEVKTSGSVASNYHIGPGLVLCTSVLFFYLCWM